tara:strand:+ start:307 stop:696 length:390 start_codon:yes stop_codon:yes gene_type:complete
MQINKEVVKNLRTEIQGMFDSRLDHWDDLVAHVGNASFTDTEVTFKLSVRVKGSKPKDERDLEDYISMLGANIDKDRIVKYRDMDLKLVGYKRVNRKYPFILQDVATSKRYKFPTDWVNANFSIEEMAS